MPISPLAKPQRETSGASTFGKYRYQYHWALQQALEAFAAKKEYALLIEYHEDVVLSDGLEPSTARFDFYQVKNVAAALSIADIVRADTGGSILEKMLAIRNRVDTVRISSICLVSAVDFGHDIKHRDELDVLKLKVADLHDTSIAKLNTALDGLVLPIMDRPLITFVRTTLPATFFEDNLVGAISGVVEKLYPGSLCNASSIYRALIDDLERKGCNPHDYGDWEDLLKHKALLSNDVERLFLQFTQVKDQTAHDKLLDELIDKIGQGILASQSLKKAARRYRIDRIGNRSTVQLDLQKKLSAAIEQHLPANEHDVGALLTVVRAAIPSALAGHFLLNDLDGAILGELVHYLLAHE